MTDLVFFNAFRFDPGEQRLFRGAEEIRLRPKAVALLHHLLKHPGRLITKSELLQAVWPSTNVSDAALKVCISEIRRALGDRRGVAPLIETRHRRGYRLVVAPEQTRKIPLVGRDREIEKLRAIFETALRGERQTVLVTGEAGIGKTAAVDGFLDQIAVFGSDWVARGQCLSQHAPGEAFHPVLEAFNDLAPRAGKDGLLALLSAAAPVWEITQALEQLTAESPLILVIEDLQWADHCTLDLVLALAQHRQPSRLMAICTMRPIAALDAAHHLRVVAQELQIHGRCVELPLAPLTLPDVVAYLRLRFPSNQLPDAIAAIVYDHTEGNPLFIDGVVDDLVTRGVIVEQDATWTLTVPLDDVDIRVPLHVKHMIELQLDRVSSQQRRVLDAASVAGMEFSAAAVAAMLIQDVTGIEEQCEALTRRQRYLVPQSCESRPSQRTAAMQYRFLHTFYQQMLYHALLPRTRSLWQQRLDTHAHRSQHGDSASPKQPPEQLIARKRGD